MGIELVQTICRLWGQYPSYNRLVARARKGYLFGDLLLSEKRVEFLAKRGCPQLEVAHLLSLKKSLYIIYGPDTHKKVENQTY